VNEGRIEIEGEHRDRLIQELLRRGTMPVKRAIGKFLCKLYPMNKKTWAGPMPRER
jgi:hypothetical protein